MLHHVSVGVRDVERAAKFYDPVLKALGYRRVMEFLPYALAYGEAQDRPEFWIGLPHDQKTPSAGNGTHVGFSARSKQAVDRFHTEALKAGGSNNGDPGPRPDYGPSYYGAFIYDLDGNKIEATLHLLVSDAAKAAARKPGRKTAAKSKSAKAKAPLRKLAKAKKTSRTKSKKRR